MKGRLGKLVLPIFIETALVMLLGVVDTIMLSQHSDNSVAAVGVVNQIVNLAVLVFQVISFGTTVLCSQYLGAGLKERMVQATGVAIVLNAVSGIIISSCLYFGCTAMLKMMGLRPELLSEGVSYMHIVGAFAFFQAISLAISASLRSAGKAKYPMMVTVVVNILNIIGNYTLIFGKFGMPALGAEGAAISTSISRTVSMIMLIMMLQRKLIPRFPLRLFRPFPYHEMRKLLKIGLPSAGENISYNLQQLVLIYFINMIGNEALAARIYVGNIVMFVYLYAICIAQGSSIMVGHLTGVEKNRASYVMGKFTWHRGSVVSMFFSVLCALCGPLITDYLTDNQEIAQLVCWCFWVDVLLEIGKCINIWATNTLRATGDIFFPFYVGIIVQWIVGVGFGYLFGIVFGFGLVGMWFAFVLDENIRGIIFVQRWNSLKWIGKGFVK